MSSRSRQIHALDEETSATVGFTVRDELGNRVPAAAFTSATLTLYDERSGTVLNSRDHVTILNANNVTIGAPLDGDVRWSVQPADGVIQNDQLSVERHVALFEFFWPTGTFRHEVVLDTSDVSKLT